YRDQLGLDVRLLAPLEPDGAAWNEQRQQWIGERLNEHLHAERSGDGALIIGITGEDIYIAASDWAWAFGLRADEDTAVGSYFRMDPRLYDESPDRLHLRVRLRRMVTKDLGIMLYGLGLSADPASPVYKNIDGLDELDAIEDDLARAGFPVRSVRENGAFIA